MARPGEHAGAAPDRAASALEEALEGVDDDPQCAVCAGDADFFLYEPDRVRKFVCWEHVSPVSAVVRKGADLDRPLAVPLSEEFA